MTKEKEQILFEKFPKIFPNGYDVNITENLMYFGFECDDGWFDIIYNLCDHLQKYVDTYRIGDQEGLWKPTQVTAVQVKEKYGTLRFYINGNSLIQDKDPSKFRWDYKMDGIISHACFLSSITCEVCGDKGRVRGYRWLKCLCNKCAKELDYPTDESLENDE